MRRNRTRFAMMHAAILVVGALFLSGCADTNSAALEVFLTDLLSNAAAALLL